MCEKEREGGGAGRMERIELRLKRLAVVGAILGFVLTGLNILQVWQQRRLSRAQEQLTLLQVGDATERGRVHLKVETATSDDAPDKGVVVFVTATNNSTRSIGIAMVGVRIWKHTWRSGDTLLEKPELLVWADNVVADCPAHVCPRQTPRSTLRGGYPETVPPGGSMAAGFGPYLIPAAELKRGVWIQAFVRPVEKNDGSRCVVAGPPSLENGFPSFCVEARKVEKDCHLDADCLFFDAVPLYYQPGRR
ncbi:MAG: hypothetical protein LC800_19810 [Acidobacteria bacterium]|nr:hypothetical protein [Acidobacteriota bacterium]